MATEHQQQLKEKEIEPKKDTRNFFVFAAHLILERMGWIFKTETVIMPGFLDHLGASAMMRGCLPMISRIGQSLPQIFVAHRATGMLRHKVSFLVLSLLQALPWAVLAVWLTAKPRVGDYGFLTFFFALYFVHNLVGGARSLFAGTLQGKLIQARQRGRLMAVSSFVGCILAVVVARALMPLWLRPGQENYAALFLMTACGFFLASLVIALLREPVDDAPQSRKPFISFVVASFSLLHQNRGFGRFLFVVGLMQAVLFLFPHYTPYGVKRLGLEPMNFVLFVMAQNLANALASAMLGPVADRYGNRLVLCMLIGLAGAVPFLAIVLGSFEPQAVALRLYWIVFACLGLVPVSQRIVINYVLELTPTKQHAQSVGMVNMVQVVPMIFAPLAGLCIDRFNFEPVFIGCALLTWFAGLLALRLPEPRIVR